MPAHAKSATVLPRRLEARGGLHAQLPPVDDPRVYLSEADGGRHGALIEPDWV
jgi:hypothetical protein